MGETADPAGELTARNSRAAGRGMLHCFVGPTGGGKTTVSQTLVKTCPERYTFSISVTTRLPRPNEVPGESYHFIGRTEFEQRVRDGLFFEWEEVHGNLYGTLRKTLDEAFRSSRDLLLDVDIKGALKFKCAFPQHALIYFLLPPSFEVLRARLLARGPVGRAELERRFLTARREYQTLLSLAREPGRVDYVIVNDLFDQTVQTVEAIILAEQARAFRISEKDLQGLCRVPV